MTIDLDEIEAAARAATPGPWERIKTTVYALWTVRGEQFNRVTISAYTDPDAPETDEQVCHHIATMDPQTTLALVAEVRRLRVENEKLRDDIRQMVEKAAAKSLDGYRELGSRAVQAEAQRDACRAELERLENAAAKMAAGQCIVQGGLVGDEGGTLYCTPLAKNEKLREALQECSDDLAEWVDQGYPSREQYPHMAQKFENDMGCVHKARALLRADKGGVK